MEQNMPVIAKKAWSLVRVLFYMMRKGIAKGKLMADLNIMLKRGKIAAFIYNFNHRRSDRNRPRFPSPPPGEYEFSCGNSPANSHPPSLFSSHKKHSSNNNSNSHFFSCAQAPQTDEGEETGSVNAAAVMKALEMLHSHTEAEASPALPGFGKTPTVRQLRVTDSPFPLPAVDENSHVDEDAEKFIMKFHNELKRQNKSAELSHR